LIRSAAPDWANCVNDEACRKLVATGDLGLASLATAEKAALMHEFWASRPTDCSVNASAAKQRGVGGVDDRVQCQRCDVGFVRVELHGG